MKGKNKLVICIGVIIILLVLLGISISLNIRGVVSKEKSPTSSISENTEQDNAKFEETDKESMDEINDSVRKNNANNANNENKDIKDNQVCNIDPNCTIKGDHSHGEDGQGEESIELSVDNIPNGIDVNQAFDKVVSLSPEYSYDAKTNINGYIENIVNYETSEDEPAYCFGVTQNSTGASYIIYVFGDGTYKINLNE